jgi:hypothetical protein
MRLGWRSSYGLSRVAQVHSTKNVVLDRVFGTNYFFRHSHISQMIEKLRNRPPISRARGLEVSPAVQANFFSTAPAVSAGA